MPVGKFHDSALTLCKVLFNFHDYHGIHKKHETFPCRTSPFMVPDVVTWYIHTYICGVYMTLMSYVWHNCCIVEVQHIAMRCTHKFFRCKFQGYHKFSFVVEDNFLIKSCRVCKHSLPHTVAHVTRLRVLCSTSSNIQSRSLCLIQIYNIVAIQNKLKSVYNHNGAAAANF